MGLQYFTLVHILISLVGIASGFGMLAGLLAAKLFPRWTAVFLTTTVATSATGFFFPFRGFTPALAFGVLSLVVLAVAIYALYLRRLTGSWRPAFVSIALYLNCFVLVAQLFQKIPPLTALAPTQSEPAFAITQGIVLITFLWLGILATKRFRGGWGSWV